ncbi:MAG: histidinol-phosphatase [Lentisphaeria bacterium]|nr:histidinol-phosphatase [Lentisphaeria bacterium]
MNANFHTHTYRCKHATGNIKDYCLEARKQNVSTLGFSEHIPFKTEEMNIRYRRIAPHELPLYCQDIEDARNEFPDLTLYKGLELEYETEYFSSYYPELKEKLELDYMIGAVHYIYKSNGELLPFWDEKAIVDFNDYRRFMEGNIHFMETGLLLYLAHPDAFSRFYPYWTEEHAAVTRDVFACAEALKIPLELNANGWRKKDIVLPDGTTRKLYPWQPFWELATEYNIECVVGSDAHKPEDVWGNSPDIVAFAEKLGLPLVNDKLAAKIEASREKSGRK